MTSALLVLLSLAALSVSVALLSAALDLPLLADVLVAIAAVSGVAAFLATAVFTVRRARACGRAVRP
jgi:uncharacterized membrane protein YhaH (DUF805 family)